MNATQTSFWLKFSGIFLLIMLTSLAIFAQSPTISGQWKGQIYQTNGTVKTEYEIELNLHHLPDKVIGRSYVYADGIFAEMKLLGAFTQGNTFTFRDTEILRSEEGQEMGWCMKNVILKLVPSTKGWELHGTWTGKNQFSVCNPGTLILKKVTNRA